LIRRVLQTVLADAAARSDWIEVAMAASWADAIEAIDRWADEAAPQTLIATLGRVESLPAADQFAALRATVPDVCRWAAPMRQRGADAACTAVRVSGAPRRICIHVDAAFDEMCSVEAGDGVVVDQLMAAVQSAGHAMAIPTHEGSLTVQRAIRVLDERLYARLERLSRQAAWLAACDDVWTEPGAMVVVAGLLEDARRRAWLATLAAPAFWDEADTTVRGDVSECVNAVHGDLDDARTHARVQKIASRCGTAPSLLEALHAIGWPVHPVDQLHWSPPHTARREAGRLLERLRARAWFAEERNLRGWRQVSEELEAAALAVLATLRSQVGPW
jgi:hypothetical protein